MADHQRMIVDAARQMCRVSSEACGVDFEDNWKIYGDAYLTEAQQVLDAAGVPELLEALSELVSLEADGRQCSDAAIEAWERARAAIDRATGAQP